MTLDDLPPFLFVCFLSLFVIACSPPVISSVSNQNNFSCNPPAPPLNATVLPTPSPPGTIMRDNEGSVCFYPESPTSFRANVSTDSSVCLSSSCTSIFERTGDMQIAPGDHILKFTARFAARGAYGEGGEGYVCECTADCGGAGYLDFETGDLEEGVWSIMLGDLKLGDLVVPPQTQQYVCFSSQATSIPYRPTPTRDATAYPPPSEQTPIPANYPSGEQYPYPSPPK